MKRLLNDRHCKGGYIMAVRLPVTTTVGHVSRAISFFELTTVYFGLGKTSPWEGESEPDFSAPLPSVEARTLDELIGMKRVDVKSLVYPDEDGTVVYRDQTWRKVSADEAIKLGAHWVYIEASIMYDELPATAYRQIGVFSRVKLKSGVSSSKSVLLPADIQDVGVLEVFDQRKVVTRNEDSKDTFSMIIEF